MHTRTALSSRKITGYQQRGDVDPSPTPPARCPRGIKGVFGPVGATLVVAQPIPIIRIMQTSWQSWFRTPPPWCPRGIKGVFRPPLVSPAMRGKCPKGKGGTTLRRGMLPNQHHHSHHSNIMVIMVQKRPLPINVQARRIPALRDFLAHAQNDRNAVGVSSPKPAVATADLLPRPSLPKS